MQPLTAQAVFSLVFEIPISTATSHTITAVSSKGQSAKTTFTSERTVSREVKLVSPADGNEYILFESAWDVYSSTFKYIFSIFDYISGAKKSIYQSKPVVVDWSDVPLQGVTYVLDVADADNPSVSVISKEIKEKSQYSISGNESLPPGKYTWKVKSRYEGTDSSWSESRDFEIITMPVRVLLFTIAIGILVIAAIVFIVLLIRANLRRY
jgi:hypothetical protein